MSGLVYHHRRSACSTFLALALLLFLSAPVSHPSGPAGDNPQGQPHLGFESTRTMNISPSCSWGILFNLSRRG